MSATFGSERRLKKRSEFLRLQSEGRKLYSKHFVILLEELHQAETSRLGVTVTRKVDPTSVGRNRLRRRIRELFRKRASELFGCFDLLVIARKNASDCSYADVEREILGALRHHGLLRRKDA